MISFLNPALLWALPLAAVPVILHLIFLRRARRVPFSDLTLLRAAYSRTLPVTRLRQWLILLLRVLMIGGLILAFARPVFHRRASAGGSEHGLDVVLLLDVSWSMGAEVRGKTRLDWAASAGRSIAGLLRPADRVAAAVFSDKLDGALAWAESRAAASAAIERARAGRRPTDTAEALRAAYAFLEKESAPASRRRVIVVLSDNAAHSLRNLPRRGLRGIEGYDPEVTLLGIAWDESLDNAGILDVRPAEGAGSSAQGPSLLARCGLYGPARTGWPLGLWSRTRRVQEHSLDLSPGPDSPRAFRLPPSPAAERWGRFELRRDRMPADDVYHYSLRLQPKPKVLLLYGNPSYLEAGRGGYFLKNLLEEGESLPYALDLADLGRLRALRLEDYGAVILADFRTLPPGMPDALKRYVLRGGGLWILAGTQARPDTYRALGRLMPGTLGRPIAYLGASRLLPKGKSVPRNRARGEFRWADFELKQVAMGRSYAMAPAPEAKTWFHDSLGRPLLTAGTFGQGRVLLWASSLDVEWTNLALKPVFTAWVDTGLRHLTGYTGRVKWRTLKVGEPIRRAWTAGELAPGKVQIRGPAGRRTMLLVRDRKVEYGDTREPGLYFLHPLGASRPGAGGGDSSSGVEAYAVNVERSTGEPDLTPAARLPWTRLRPDKLREDFFRSVYGREGRTGALLLIVLLLALESFLARPNPLSGPTGSEEAV